MAGVTDSGCLAPCCMVRPPEDSSALQNLLNFGERKNLRSGPLYTLHVCWSVHVQYVKHVQHTIHDAC